MQFGRQAQGSVHGALAVTIALVLTMASIGPATASPARAATDPQQLTIDDVEFRAVDFHVSVSAPSSIQTWIEYGTSTAYGSECCGPYTQQAGNFTLNLRLAGLTPGTAYHMRAVTLDGLDPNSPRIDGPDVTFTTKAAEPPGFIFDQAVWTPGCCETLTVGVDTNGADTSIHFDYGTTSRLGRSTRTQTVFPDDYGHGYTIDPNISRLASGTTYYWRAVLANSAGALTTQEATFDTGGAPNTMITAGPAGTSTLRRATFRFGATSQHATFQCDLDGRAWHGCTSPATYSSLSRTGHRFSVRAVGSKHEIDPTPAVRTWRVR